MILPEGQVPTETTKNPSKYASVLFQSKEVYDIECFRFPIYNTLTPAEAKAYADYEKATAAKQLKSVEFARAMGKKLNRKTREILDALTDRTHELFDELVYDNTEAMTNLRDSTEVTEELNKFITVVMRSRGRVQLTPESEYVKTTDWTETDTLGLLTVANRIFEFINWEKDGWPPTTTEDTDKLPEVETAPLEIQQQTSFTPD